MGIGAGAATHGSWFWHCPRLFGKQSSQGRSAFSSYSDQQGCTDSISLTLMGNSWVPLGLLIARVECNRGDPRWRGITLPIETMGRNSIGHHWLFWNPRSVLIETI